MTINTTDVIVRFECPAEDRISREYRFEFVQLTYDELRIGPDGDTFAFFSRESQEWRFSTDGDGERVPATASVPDPEFGQWWSDIIISGVDQHAPSRHQVQAAVATA